MCQIDEKNQTQQEEEHGAEESNIIAVDEEEAFRNEERHDNEPNPEEHFWSPEAILKGGAAIPGCLHAKEQEGENQVEETETEVDAMDRDPTVTFLSIAFDFHIVEGQVLQFFECPGSQHNPGNDRVDQEDKGIGDSSCHTVKVSA